MEPKRKISRQHNPFPSRPLSVNETKRIGRNSLCFCGSQKKFKFCCIKKVEELENESKKLL